MFNEYIMLIGAKCTPLNISVRQYTSIYSILTYTEYTSIYSILNILQFSIRFTDFLLDEKTFSKKNEQKIFIIAMGQLTPNSSKVRVKAASDVSFLKNLFP